MEQRLRNLIAQTSLIVTDLQISQLVGYVKLLDKWNKAYNLTSVRDPNEMLIKHIMDSLVVSTYLQGDNFIDVGTGPGLPGIPLAIMNPNKSFTLLDSLGKRIRFIRQVIHELKIENVTPVQSRVELFLPEVGFDAVLSRAFASMTDMVTWCRHLPNANSGVFYALKGQCSQEEIDLLPEWCEVQSVLPLSIPELDGERHLVVIKEKK